MKPVTFLEFAQQFFIRIDTRINSLVEPLQERVAALEERMRVQDEEREAAFRALRDSDDEIGGEVRK